MSQPMISNDASDVLITSDAAKLPPAIADLLDPAKPLPTDVAFFEQRFTIEAMFKRLAFAVGFAIAALVIVPLGGFMVIADLRGPQTVYSRVDWLPLGFGLVCGLAAWMMFASIITCMRLRDVQRLGQSTRRGTFMTPDALVQASENDTMVIPRARFRGLVGNDVTYALHDAPKSFRLPTTLMNATPTELHAAITRWAIEH